MDSNFSSAFSFISYQADKVKTSFQQKPISIANDQVSLFFSETAAENVRFNVNCFEFEQLFWILNFIDYSDIFEQGE